MSGARLTKNDGDAGTVIENLITGQYQKPVRVISFNTAEGWARDVSEDIARAAIERAGETGRELSGSGRMFVEWMTGEEVKADVT